jgi:hypothetical protein
MPSQRQRPRRLLTAMTLRRWLLLQPPRQS